MSIQSSACYRPNGDSLASTIIDGDAVLVNLATGVYYSLDGPAGTVWQMIERHRSVGEIVYRLISLYETTQIQATADVEALMARLLAEDLIAETTPGPDAPPDPEPPARLPYRAPQMEMYTDMSDLLALDPPMPGLFESTK